MGSNGNDRAYAIQRITDSTYAIGGEWYLSDSLSSKAYIAMIHDNGTVLWEKHFGHYSGAYEVHDLTKTPDGIMFGGWRTVNANNHDNLSGTISFTGVLLQEITHLDNASTIENNRYCQLQYVTQQNVTVIGYQTINSLTNQDNFDLGFGYFDALYGFWMPNFSGTSILNEGLDAVSYTHLRAHET